MKKFSNESGTTLSEILFPIPIFIVLLAILIPTCVQMSKRDRLCKEAGPGAVVEYLDKEYTCPED